MIAEDEKRAQQALLDKASAETARLSRKLAETEASFNALQGRLRHVEAKFTEANTELNSRSVRLCRVWTSTGLWEAWQMARWKP